MAIKDITGQKFGKLLVINGKLPNQMILVKCDCGLEKSIKRYDVLNKNIKSCGSKGCRDIGKNLKNYTFGFLYVLDQANEIESKKIASRCVQWKCQCICGKIIIVPSNQLFSNKTKSCGCKKNELMKATKSEPLKIRLEGVFYNAYKSRCNRDKNEFSLSKEEFIKFIYSECFYCKSKPEHFFSRNINNDVEGILVNGIDRINNDLGYLSSNCITCCKRCNYAKNTQSIYDFFLWCKNIAFNLSNIETIIFKLSRT